MNDRKTQNAGLKAAFRELASGSEARAAELAAGFAARAGDAGLLDVAYATTDSPFGPIMLAATPRGLVSLGLPNQDAEDFLDRLVERISPRVLEMPARFEEARR